MKSIKYGIWLFMLFALMACGGGTGDGSSPAAEPAVREMRLGQSISGFISNPGEVDTFHLRPMTSGRYLKIHCKESSIGSEADLLVIASEDNNGERRRVFGRQQRDGATIGADMNLWVYIDDLDTDLYITVRDFMQDETSGKIAYSLMATLQDNVDGNHDLSTAQSIDIGADGAVIDEIEEVGEVDYFSFEPAADGVYRVNVDHNKPDDGTNVQLTLTLYDHQGHRIQRLSDPLDTILAHLTQASGPYYVAVEDTTSMNADLSAPFSISVEAVDGVESQANDVSGSATEIPRETPGVYTAAGTIDYGCASESAEPGVAYDSFPDVDWYELVVGVEGGSTTHHQMELNIDDGPTVAGLAPFRVIVYDSSDNIVTSHIFMPNSEAYLNQFRVQNGRYFISVAPLDSQRIDSGVNYLVQLTEVDLNDDHEETDLNTANTARSLNETGELRGIVSYHSDVDWYTIDVNTATAQVLTVEFTTDTASIVDYQVTIWRGVEELKRVTDNNGSDGPTHLRTSILVKADNPSAIVPFTIKVSDAQNSEGSNVEYTIRANLAEVPLVSPDHVVGLTSGTLRYYGETEAEAATADEDMIQLEIYSIYQPVYRVNTDWLDFRSTPLEPGINLTPAGANTVITFPWITGYIDYHGDRDFFKLDLDKLDPDDTTVTRWYYDIEVRLVVPGGSDTEHVWTLYRDSNGNQVFMDNPGAEDGYKGLAGDITLTADEVNVSSPPAGQADTLWIGQEWGGGESMFYFAISDFNYKQLPDDTGTPNPNLDEDWGYDAPYYFTITLTYHPDQVRP